MLPRVFTGESIPRSDVWNTPVTFERGKRYLVAAESGAGKSSMCSFIYGTRNDYDGKLEFDGIDSTTFNISHWQHLRRQSLAYLPQDLMLFPELSAIENIIMKNKLTNHVDESEIDEWLKLLGIYIRKNYPVGRMSVGQQQRVAIIRALCQPFDFILLDEPVSHLDETNNKIVATLISEVASKNNAGIISTSVGNPLLLENAQILNL